MHNEYYQKHNSVPWSLAGIFSTHKSSLYLYKMSSFWQNHFLCQIHKSACTWLTVKISISVLWVADQAPIQIQVQVRWVSCRFQSCPKLSLSVRIGSPISYNTDQAKHGFTHWSHNYTEYTQNNCIMQSYWHCIHRLLVLSWLLTGLDEKQKIHIYLKSGWHDVFVLGDAEGLVLYYRGERGKIGLRSVSFVPYTPILWVIFSRHTLFKFIMFIFFIWKIELSLFHLPSPQLYILTTLLLWLSFFSWPTPNLTRPP